MAKITAGTVDMGTMTYRTGWNLISRYGGLEAHVSIVYLTLRQMVTQK